MLLMLWLHSDLKKPALSRWGNMSRARSRAQHQQVPAGSVSTAGSGQGETSPSPGLAASRPLRLSLSWLYGGGGWVKFSKTSDSGVLLSWCVRFVFISFHFIIFLPRPGTELPELPQVISGNSCLSPLLIYALLFHGVGCSCRSSKCCFINVVYSCWVFSHVTG